MLVTCHNCAVVRNGFVCFIHQEWCEYLFWRHADDSGGGGIRVCSNVFALNRLPWQRQGTGDTQAVSGGQCVMYTCWYVYWCKYTATNFNILGQDSDFSLSNWNSLSHGQLRRVFCSNGTVTCGQRYLWASAPCLITRFVLMIPIWIYVYITPPYPVFSCFMVSNVLRAHRWCCRCAKHSISALVLVPKRYQPFLLFWSLSFFHLLFSYNRKITMIDTYCRHKKETCGVVLRMWRGDACIAVVALEQTNGD